MAEKTKAELKAYFETGDKPTQNQFADLIDNTYNIPQEKLFDTFKKTLDYQDLLIYDTLFTTYEFFTLPDNYLPFQITIVINTQFITPNTPTWIFQIRNSADTFSIYPTTINLSNLTSTLKGQAKSISFLDYFDLPLLPPYNNLKGYIYSSPSIDKINTLTEGNADIYFHCAKIF